VITISLRETLLISQKGVWSDEDLEHILGRYGAFVVKRQGTDIEQAMENLQQWKDNIYVSYSLTRVGFIKQ
jgi:nicotinamide mononucleotide adenylyltransferase